MRELLLWVLVLAFLLFALAWTDSPTWAWVISGVFSVIASIFLLFIRGTIRDLRDYRRTERLFEDLVRDGLPRVDAIAEVSRRRHPELSPEVHLAIAGELGEIDRFVGFMVQAADFGKKTELTDKKILILLETTTLVPIGHGVYVARIDWRRYFELMRQEPGPGNG